jgi:glycosyltransferase involved in cell wall biosynthesis
MQKVQASPIFAGVAGARVIPNGVDLALFRPAPRERVRAELGLDPEGRVLLFAANGIRKNPFKDFETLRATLARLGARHLGEKVLFLALGEAAPPERVGDALLRFVPLERDPARVARYYQAADLYLHAAREDTFPSTILEALACGTPVVATSVGGIPEQVDDGRTGFLVEARDAEALARGAHTLLVDADRRARMSAAAREAACDRFDLDRCASEYLSWYRALTCKS